MIIKAHFIDGRPAIGYGIILQFETEDLPDPDGDHHHPHREPETRKSKTVALITDSKGMARYEVPPTMTFKRIWRVTRSCAQSYRYDGRVKESGIDISITGWPSPVAELREVLMGSTGNALRLMADTVLTNAQNLLAKQVQRDQVDLWRPDDGDNPHIRAGAVLVALSISCVYASSDPAAKAALRGIEGIVNWLEHRRHPNEPGYLLRWKQSQLDSRQGDDWKAEPSLDEYSGILLGLGWLRKLGPRFRVSSPELMGRVNALWDGIDSYLNGTEGWLVRPGGRDLTARGPDLAVSGFILYQLFGHRYEHPFELSDSVKDIIKRSQNYYDSCDLGDNGFKATYSGTIKLVEFILKGNEVSKAMLLSELALDLLTLGGFVVNPGVGSFCFMLAGAVSAIRENYDEKLLGVHSGELWGLFAKALGSPYRVDGGGFNAHIFDRQGLAAFWEGNVGMSSYMKNRYTRPLQADRNGWRILTLAGRYIYSSASMPVDELANTLNAEIGYFRAMGQVPTNLETLEGFLLGWCLLCFVADVDPEIDWAKYLG